MQDASFKLLKQEQGALPLIDDFIEKTGLQALLKPVIGNQRYVDALLLLLKNILVERNALYAIREWSGQFDPLLVYGGRIGDDVMARALDRLFESDRGYRSLCARHAEPNFALGKVLVSCGPR